jgi:hypothetical protein
MSEIGYGTLDAAIAPDTVLLGQANHQRFYFFPGAGRPGPRFSCPSYFCAISFRCQANKVSGVTRVATSARSLRPNPLALAAKRRRWSSLNRNRRSPSCSRRTRFSSRRYSIVCCGRRFIQPATATSKNWKKSSIRAIVSLNRQVARIPTGAAIAKFPEPGLGTFHTWIASSA